MREPIVKKVESISVARFYEQYRGTLELQLLNSPLGMTRPILQPTVNRPGLALAGYFGYFAHERIQVFGAAEVAYMQQLDAEERNARLELLLKKDIPCIVFSCGGKVPQDLLNMADEHCVSVFSSNLVTVNLVNRATIILENEFADSTTVHGCMVDVRGVGVLLTGESGIGKSEISLGLVERGSSLVADDMVRIRNSSGELIAACPSSAAASSKSAASVSSTSQTYSASRPSDTTSAWISSSISAPASRPSWSAWGWSTRPPPSWAWRWSI